MIRKFTNQGTKEIHNGLAHMPIYKNFRNINLKILFGNLTNLMEKDIHGG